jgi:hypothetical protein
MISSQSNETEMTAQTRAEELAPKSKKQVIFLILAVLVTILVSPVLIHVTQVHYLQQAASNIDPGDTRADVVKLLGTPEVTYTTGFPPGGGMPTVWGSCYGGLLNSIRSTIDGCVYNACNAVPHWYEVHVAQHGKAWPVTIEFDKSGKVIAVNR